MTCLPDDERLANASIKRFIPPTMHCFVSRPGALIFTSFYAAIILVCLPLCVCVAYLGLQPRRRCSPTHSDFLALHAVAVEALAFIGYTVFLCGIYQVHADALYAGFCLWSFAWYCETLFGVLTSVEHYLAVVRPIAYLSLRGGGGVRVRNAAVGVVWLVAGGGAGLLSKQTASLVADFWLLASSLTAVLFCNLSVLCTLIRPGPGEGGGAKRGVEKSKHRAFFTITTILGMLLVRITWNMVWIPVNINKASCDCVTLVLGVWFNLPTNLMLPALFLHRARPKKKPK